MPRQCQRIIGAGAFALLTLIMLGCMSFSFGGKNYCHPKCDSEGVFCQEGKVAIPLGEERTVYYPVPFASPPHLDVTADLLKVALIEQKADCFRICCKSDVQFLSPPTIRWKAQGVRRLPPGDCPLVPVPLETVPPPKLPELPPPVETPRP